MWCNVERLLTQINAVEEREIQRGSNGEFLVLREDDMTAVVTLLDRLQDVCGVILTTTESLDAAGLGSWR